MADESSNSARVVHITAAAGARTGVSLARLPAAVHRVREKASQLLQQALKNLFDGADDALYQLADKATSNEDQNIYFEAMREVRLQRRSMEAGFFAQLDQAYAALMRYAGADSDDLAEIQFDDLSLVGKEQLEYQVALEGLVAKAMKQVAEPAQHIALRLDSLLPAKVYQRNNPLGPDVLCQSFWVVVEPLDLNIKAKLILLKLFDKAVISQLDTIYRVANNTFIQNNILPSLSTRARRPQPAPLRPRAESPPASAANPVDASAGGDPQLWESLRQLLGGATGAASVTGDAVVVNGPALESARVSEALSTVQHLLHSRAIEAGERLLSSGQILRLVQQQARVNGHFSEPDRDVIHLINLLFEFILEDRNLNAAMKVLLARLQIPLLKVALDNKAFFNVSGHPARRLLNELATAALGWQPPEDGSEPRDPLYQKIEATVAAVLASFEHDVSVFETLLTDFIAFVEKERRRAVVLEKRTLDAEDGKARADQAKARVQEQLVASTLGRDLPACVEGMLEGPWHNVMFLLLLKHGEQSDEWLSACDTLDDLIWSVTALMDGEGRLRLMGLLPDLLGRLKAGFELIAFNSFEMNALLRQLEAEHLARLRQPDPAMEDPAPVGEGATSSGDAHQVYDTALAQPAAAPAAKPEPEEPVAAEPPAPAVDSSWLEQVDRFAQGAWFEVAEEGKSAFRCRLAAVIRGVDRYIFVNRNGMKVAEKSRLELARSLQNGHFRMLDDGMLFDRALASVIGNLRAARSRSASAS